MSRHEIRPRNPGHKVIVGWGPPLQTFFAQVIDKAKEAAGSDRKHLLWIGCKAREIVDIEDLRQRIKGYAYLPADIRTKLYGDRDADVA